MSKYQHTIGSYTWEELCELPDSEIKRMWVNLEHAWDDGLQVNEDYADSIYAQLGKRKLTARRSYENNN